MTNNSCLNAVDADASILDCFNNGATQMTSNGCLNAVDADASILDWLNNGATQMTRPINGFLNAVDVDASILDWLNNGATQMTRPSNSCLNAIDADASISSQFLPSTTKTLQVAKAYRYATPLKCLTAIYGTQKICFGLPSLPKLTSAFL